MPLGASHAPIMFLATFISEWLKYFFLLTPFFVLSVFLTYTAAVSRAQRRNLAIRVCVAVLIIVTTFLLFGGYMFQLFGITLDAFRIGAGTLLFLSGISLARETRQAPPNIEDLKTAAVVPLAIPVTVGPATTGAILIMGADMRAEGIHLPSLLGVLAAILTLGLILYLSAHIEKLLGKLGITILSRLTGLVLTALAAEIMFEGIRGLLAG